MSGFAGRAAASPDERRPIRIERGEEKIHRNVGVRTYWPATPTISPNASARPTTSTIVDVRPLVCIDTPLHTDQTVSGAKVTG
jgi:hypothetical protein